MTETTPTPPVAAVRPVDLTLHGHTRRDPYFWLRERENPEVVSYVEAENAYTEQVMAHTARLQETLYQEMVGRIQETDQSVPVHIDDFFYYTRTEEGKQYPIYCRRAGSMEAPEEILLEPNALAEGLDHLEVGVFEISPDHSLLAYSLDTTGGERYTIHIKDLRSGELLADEIPNTGYVLEWGNDNRTLFYVVQDDAWRSYRLCRHVLGTPVTADEIVHQEDDALYSVHAYKTRDERLLVMTVHAIETNESYLLSADEPAGAFTLVQPRETGMRYYVDHRDGLLYIITNADGATNYKVVTAPLATPGRAHWSELLPHRPAVKVDDLDLFARHMVVYERENGLRTLRVINLETGADHYVPFDEPVYTFSSGDNPNYDTRLLRYEYTSLATPETTYDYDMETGARTFLKQQPVLGGYDPTHYVTERIWATAEDGVRVPISLVFRRGTERNGENPCFLYGYGSYGHSIDPAFRSNWVSLVDRGFVVAIAHIRGGQEMGRHWYDQGKFFNKRNTFTDFIACARHLIAENYTNPAKLTIMGRSAGGLLMGAVLNLAPELFRAAIAGVPFVDVVSTMLDETIPLTVGEYDEWGNPNDAEFYRYMLSYSPYDNLQPQAYPHILATSGLNDPRVMYWEPTKWVARLRDDQDQRQPRAAENQHGRRP